MIFDLPEFDFAKPVWFVLLLIIPALYGIKVWSLQNNSKGVNRMVAKRLQPTLVHRTPAVMDWMQFHVQLLALVMFITAMAQPQWGFEEKETMIEGRNIIIALDTSNSMLAGDLRPDRLSRAKLVAQDLVRHLETDRVGVIAFAGESFVQAPLTVDYEAVLETIDQIDTEIIPRGGTNLTGPALLALDTLAEGETSLGALVIFSDGEDHEGEGQLAEFERRAKASELIVIAVGVGTDGGAIIPKPKSEANSESETGSDSDGDFLRDENGEIVRSRLNRSALQRLSAVTDGIYLDMDESTTVSNIVDRALNKLEVQQMAADTRKVPIDRYYIPLVAGMAFFVLSFAWPMTPARTQRIPAAAGAIVASLLGFGLFFQPAPALAQEAEPEPVEKANGILDEIKSDKRTAIELFRAGEFIKAQARYEEEIEDAGPLQANRLRLGLGAAAYRSGDLEAAKRAYSQVLLSNSRSLQKQAHFNLGSALFESGRSLVNGVTDPEKEVLDQTREQWRSAIGHFKAALDLDNNDRRAKANLEFVRVNLDILEDPPPPPPEDDEDDENEDDNEDDQNDDQNQDNNDQNEDQNQDNNQDQNQNPPPQNNPPPNSNDNSNPPPQNQPPDGQPPESQPPPEGQPPEGQPPEGQPPEANPENGQGQPPEGQQQPPEAQPQKPPPPSKAEARRALEANADEDKDQKRGQKAEAFQAPGFKNW